ncbi:alpha-ketoglutarate-dependent dioxygenase AlkB family protein [Burkholderia glumae]|uniref:alpha-ketoglutarate-dependent dioxygenase AlkB family protein n=1 Tax=Burkholderia glumae TaxID=337 RepID=UPI000C272608|nr:alpha-ketoglutarate-dependent dioxygenase AlkB [Burkholderia glumae]MCM2552066.1 alpha-ketoglutarate-dependent dioxygenase AlkB [Burkholderia glumae]NVE24965.1 alpha-ketoglutarate-dependent dioxygenase AlkB [Burkholderia glumae]PJO20604.1 alpha-ketoglutarate-dependent dioxygenase AlkB [Burkholderia glumae AU6208]QHE12803.1 alpha-ketoglutarate-dependent dioxygenase AlkB [Burkholderia glumae AU6208]UVS98919.1 alpha-ketoglutarate-dependent dioxygenase AlkB [Burkholderia glumae]
MDDLFDSRPEPDLDWYPDWLPPADADALLARLIAEVAWRQDAIRTPRGMIPLPRLTAWQGEPDAVYVYSGIRNEPAPWSPAVAELRARAQAACRARFNSVLLNRYRTGADGMGWHADDEPELGAAPVIASVSLGATRVFHLRHEATRVVRAYRLTHGSLLVMRGATQRDWVHRLAKAPAVQGERVNLTFRLVMPRRKP